MAHPYAKHSQNSVAHRRANKLTTGNEYAKGGKIKPHLKTKPRMTRDLGLSSPTLDAGLAASGSGTMPPPPMPAGGALSPPLPGASPIMRKSGGATPNYHSGISTKGNLAKWADYASRNSYAHGGAVKPEKPRRDAGWHEGAERVPEKPISPEKTWADRIGGSKKTTKSGKLMAGKSAGQGSGFGLREYARHMKKSYP